MKLSGTSQLVCLLMYAIVRMLYVCSRRVTRGGQGALEIEKQKKKVIRANFKVFHLYFATFLVENIFAQLFSELPPYPEKKRLSDFAPSPLRISGHAPVFCVYCINYYVNKFETRSLFSTSHLNNTNKNYLNSELNKSSEWLAFNKFF